MSCDGVGVCSWCSQEVASGHLCEAMCDNVDAVLVLEHFRKELLT
jgi:ferredoxin